MLFEGRRHRRHRPEAPGPADLGHRRRGHHASDGFGARRREGREGRVFDHGDLRLVIMALIAETPRYGYDIIKVLEERVGGGYSPSPGVVYPTLTMLEELGHASVAEERGRKLYSLTSEGEAHLAAHRAAVDAILSRTQDGAGARRGPPLPIARATENLSTAVRLRFKGQPATEAQIQAAAAAIDAAAKAIEAI